MKQLWTPAVSNSEKNVSQVNPCSHINWACCSRVSQMPPCQRAAVQHTASVQRRASTIKAQMFSSSWLRESLTCPVKEAASSMLANTCLGSCSAFRFHLAASTQLWKEGDTQRKVAWLHDPELELSDAHMDPAWDEEKTCARGSSRGAFGSVSVWKWHAWQELIQLFVLQMQKSTSEMGKRTITAHSFDFIKALARLIRHRQRSSTWSPL